MSASIGAHVGHVISMEDYRRVLQYDLLNGSRYAHHGAGGGGLGAMVHCLDNHDPANWHACAIWGERDHYDDIPRLVQIARSKGDCSLRASDFGVSKT